MTHEVTQIDAILHQMATFQDGNAQPHTIALINEMADLLQAFAAHRHAAFQRGVKAGLEAAARGFRAAQYSPAPYTEGMAAIARIDPATIKDTEQ